MKKRKHSNLPAQAGGGDLKNLLSNTVRYIEVDGEILEISNEKQWTKIAEITVQENDSVYEYTDLDNLTEIFIYAVGLCNMTTTASVLQARINDEAFPFGTLDTQIASGSATRYQRLYLKYNELYWDASKGQVSSNEQNYYGQFTFFYNPYSVKLGVNKCTKLTLTSNARYNLKSGTIYIYGR